jgi:hypothetical protein
MGLLNRLEEKGLWTRVEGHSAVYRDIYHYGNEKPRRFWVSLRDGRVKLTSLDLFDRHEPLRTLVNLDASMTVEFELALQVMVF